MEKIIAQFVLLGDLFGFIVVTADGTAYRLAANEQGFLWPYEAKDLNVEVQMLESAAAARITLKKGDEVVGIQVVPYMSS